MGGVRNILWQHLWQVGHRQGVPPPTTDPTELVSAASFAESLRHHADQGNVEAAAQDYVRLWASTFRTLVRHMRGHPDRMLALFVEEFYPYLRGSGASARVKSQGRRRAQLITDAELPADYMAALVGAFVGLAGTPCHVQATAPGRFDVIIQDSARDRLIRLTHLLAHLRIPLLLAAALAATFGVAASSLVGPSPAVSVAAVLLGAIAAQSAANALQDLARRRPRSALGPPSLGRGWLLFQLTGSSVLAGAALAWLAATEPAILVFAGAGILVAIGYGPLQVRGLGPVAAWATHGLLIPIGAVVALHGTSVLATPGPVLLATLPTGLLTAALVHLDDLADMPLDEAGGRRTLVVRLPRRRQVGAFTAFVSIALLSAFGMGLLLHPITAIALGVIVATVPALVRHVRLHADDPAALAGPRLATLALLVACTTILSTTLLVSP